MSSFQLVIADQALAEIEDAVEYYNSKANHLGERFSDAVFSLLEKIQDHPFLFRIRFQNIREAVLHRFPFLITYEIIDAQIIVLSVFHTKRNPANKVYKKDK